MLRIVTTSAGHTQKIAKALAQEILKTSKKKRAFIVALMGSLGAGKTTFTQGFARALGIRERVLSPTFVLEKIYPIQKKSTFTYLVHIDFYRLKGARDLKNLGIEKMLKDHSVIILVEWPERVRRLIPSDALWIRFKHGKKQNERILNFGSRI